MHLKRGKKIEKPKALILWPLINCLGKQGQRGVKSQL